MSQSQQTKHLPLTPDTLMQFTFSYAPTLIIATAAIACSKSAKATCKNNLSNSPIRFISDIACLPYLLYFLKFH
jgi:hypothetical protein